MSHALLDHAAAELAGIRAAGLWKRERPIASPQGGRVTVVGGPAQEGAELLNLCANNYLGLADHPRLIGAAKAALDSHGFGMASVRFICGTQDLHVALEARLAAFLRMEDAILFSSCFDANGGVFEALLGPEDAVISDALNHASIIDGIRLCKARRLRYANNDMAELEARLVEARDARARLIVTDGVFSMDGIIADLPAICDLAERHDALVMVDDSHAVGFIGARGAGTPERCGVEGRVASGQRHLRQGARRRLGRLCRGAEALRRPAAPARPALSLLQRAGALDHGGDAGGARPRDRPRRGSARRARARTRPSSAPGSRRAGFTLTPGEHPIIPVMIGDAAAAARLAAALQARGVYVTAFSYPVVPQGKARIRTQMNAAHSPADLDRAIAAFAAAGRETGALA